MLLVGIHAVLYLGAEELVGQPLLLLPVILLLLAVPILLLLAVPVLLLLLVVPIRKDFRMAASVGHIFS